MPKARSLKLYANAKGSKPMTLLKTLDKDDLPASEQDLSRALELAVEAINSLPREVESQLVIVEDGLIIAVEGLTTRKLIWCN
jgi:DUF1009 family protein